MNFGIIAEYNPFHNGHLYHIKKSKEITGGSKCIVIMSGNFVQRGEPAVLNKHLRTKAALLNGADIVIELPVYYACASADLFCFGAVDLLNKTGIVDCLCFGTEAGELNSMQAAAKELSNESAEFKKLLKEETSKGVSYPKARLSALSSILGIDLSYLKSPNNILALEYIKALYTTKSKIVPYTIKRKTAGFHSTEITSSIASAAAIRNIILNGIDKISAEKIKKCIPKSCHDIFLKAFENKIPHIDNYTKILDYLLRIKTPYELSEILDITEGLENRILKNREARSITELISLLKTKRYTYTKLQRALLHIILDIKKSDINFYNLNRGIPYIRVLGFKKESSELLTALSKNALVPVITNVKNAEKQLSPSAMKMLQAELKASDIYNILITKKTNTDYTTPPVIV